MTVNRTLSDITTGRYNISLSEVTLRGTRYYVSVMDDETGECNRMGFDMETDARNCFSTMCKKYGG